MKNVKKFTDNFGLGYKENKHGNIEVTIKGHKFLISPKESTSFRAWDGRRGDSPKGYNVSEINGVYKDYAQTQFDVVRSLVQALSYNEDFTKEEIRPMSKFDFQLRRGEV